jgi:hypothetical protein
MGDMTLTPAGSRRWLWIPAALVVLGLATYLLFFQKTDRPFAASEPSFSNTSDALKRTVIVPTLDTPIPENHSAIWCSSFQLAWNELKTVAEGPIQLANAEVVAERLNKAEHSDRDLDAQDVYAAAGFVRDGIIPRIQGDVAKKFPDLAIPTFDVPPDGAVAYAYARAHVGFTIPYFDNDERFLFTNSSGKQVPVKSFGIRKKDDYAYDKLRDQVQVLYIPKEAFWRDEQVPEFVVDPCKYSQPYQMIVAVIGRKPTLAEALADVQEKIATSPAKDHVARCNPRDTLLIPAMHWRVNHHFKELEGRDKQFQNPPLQGLFLDTALQSIQFRLDRSGAELASEAKIYVKPGASYFNVTRPFLIVVKKRDAKHPFFVMWVDNAELLDK